MYVESRADRDCLHYFIGPSVRMITYTFSKRVFWFQLLKYASCGSRTGKPEQREVGGECGVDSYIVDLYMHDKRLMIYVINENGVMAKCL